MTNAADLVTAASFLMTFLDNARANSLLLKSSVKFFEIRSDSRIFLILIRIMTKFAQIIIKGMMTPSRA